MALPHHSWLLRQLPEWQQEGLITAEAAEVLRQRSESATDEESSNTAQVAMGALGALLIGAGLIAVIGYNWDAFSAPIRLLFAFIPLLASQLFSLRILRSDPVAPWLRETAGLLQTAAAGACIAIVSQIYNLGGDWPQFLLVWCIVSLPLAWVLGAHTVVMFYLIGTTIWVVDQTGSSSGRDVSVGIYFALLAGLIPYVLGFGQKKPEWPTTVRWIGTASVLVGLCAVAAHKVRIADSSYIDRSAVYGWLWLVNVALLTLVPLTRHGLSESNRRKPQVVLGFIILLGAGFAMTFNEAFVSRGVRLALALPWAWVLLAAVGGFATVAVRQKRWAVLAVTGIVLIPLISSSGQPEAYGSLASGSTMWVATIYLFLLGLALILLEFAGKQGAPRLGATLLSVLIIVRLSGSDISLLSKGIVFIFVGVGFLVFNIYVGRWRKARRALS